MKIYLLIEMFGGCIEKVTGYTDEARRDQVFKQNVLTLVTDSRTLAEFQENEEALWDWYEDYLNYTDETEYHTDDIEVSQEAPA